MPIPVYVFTGFLDAGKTKFIQETLEDPRFNAGERTLLLAFEEGEEEYDLSAFPKKNVFLEVLDQDQVTTQQLAALPEEIPGPAGGGGAQRHEAGGRPYTPGSRRTGPWPRK